MKKRILALALAGTTAFSVFGAALSANAYYVKDDNGNWIQSDENYSTHVAFGNDEYVPYEPVATKITVQAGATGTTTPTTVVDYYVDENANTIIGTIDNGKTVTSEADVEKYLGQMDFTNNYSDAEVVFVQIEGTVYNVVKSGDKAGQILTKVNPDGEDGYDSAPEVLWKALGITSTSKDADYNISVKGVMQSYKSLDKAVEVAVNSEEHLAWCAAKNTFTINPSRNGHVNNAKAISNEAYAKLNEKTAYAKKIVAHKVAGADIVTPGTIAYINVTSDIEASTNYKSWYFNSATTVSDTPISLTQVVTVHDEETGKLKTFTEYVPTIFAYDYVYNNPNMVNNAGAIAKVWNDTTKYVTDTAAVVGTGTYTAERGDGSRTYGIRAEVVSEWVDFLDSLAINHDNGYSESLEEFIDNYTERYYGDPVYDPNTGKLLGYDPVDLYNLDNLLGDIYALSARSRQVGGWITGWENANTSEMVYLMQQYNKYFEDYIAKDEVATGEWGDFLLEILNAAEADDFKKPIDYKRYVREVEDLADAYESATTVNLIKEAELGMYELLTERNASYKASGTGASKTALNTTMEGLFFNVGNVPATYATAPSTPTTNVDYKTYNYYVAVAKETAKNDWTYSAELTPGYYSLYPMADYADVTYTNKAAVYNGNKGSEDYVGYVTDEYEWFWNVYQLAYNMKANNTKQGSIDAIDAALAEAVAALNVTSTPYATEVSALDEMVEEYADMVESDYNDGYYGKYVQANDFADVAEGKQQTRIARYIVGVAGEALTYQGTQVTVTKNDILSVEAAIKEANTALKAIKDSKEYNAAQVSALNKAIADAQAIIDLYDGVASTSKDYQSVNHVYSNKVGDKDQIVKSDITGAIDAIDAAIKGSTVVQGWSKNEDGKWQYGETDGYVQSGWKKLDSVWYYFDNGAALQSEWKQIDGKWYWFNSNCGAAYGWAKVNGEWYYFGGDNAMKTGWVKVDGNWYYLAASGKMTTGWVQVGGKWYYMSKESNSLGQMLANTTVEGYKLGADGAMIEK